MADLIDRAPMLEFLDLQHYDKDMLVTQYSPDWIYSWLESQTAVDAVEVVRCKDCKYFSESGERPELFGFCHLYPLALSRLSHGFCDMGERRTDADN